MRPITLQMIMISVRRKTGVRPASPQQLIELIKSNHLQNQPCGLHNGEEITHGKAMEIVTGQRV